RTRSPCLRTLPSMRLATPSFSPIILLSSDLPLKRNDELRPITFRSGILASTAINSSERPSEKYSLAGSPLVLTSGNTTTPLGDVQKFASRGELALGPDLERKSWKVNNPAASNAATIVRPTILRPVGRATDWPGSTSDSRLIPSGVSSKAQDKIKATGKPKMSSKTTSRTAQFGISKNGKTCVAI